MDNKEKNFISAVIYVHNAEDRIREFLMAILRQLEEMFEHSEIICVNDASTDDSVAEIKDISKMTRTTNISLLNLSYFHGLEGAMNAGVDLSIGDFVLEFDNTDLDFEGDVIADVYQQALNGYDIVSASPNKKTSKSSKMFYYIFDKFNNINYNMQTESFRILSRRVINRISSMNKTIPYRKALYSNCGLKTYNLKYKTTNYIKNRVDSAEKRYRQKLAVDSLIIFTNIGYEFSKVMTLFMIAATIFMAVYSVFVYLTNNPVEGWTTIMLFLAFCFCGLFGVLTFIMKYLQIIVDLVFKRKHYSFDSIEKLTK